MPRLLTFLLFTFLLMLLCSLKSQPQNNEYSFRHLTTKQGLPSNIVNSIIKDSTGFMWFGTGNGLVRYDGYSFKTYNFPYDSITGSANQTAIELLEYNKYLILVGTSHHGLLIFDKIDESFTSYTHNLKSSIAADHNWVNSVFRDKKGIIWIGTQCGLDRFDITNGIITTFRQEPDKSESLKDHLRAVFEDSQGILWLGTADGVYHFNRKTEEFTKFNLRSEIPEGYFRKVTCFVEDKNGIIWIGTLWGLYKFNRIVNTIKTYLPWELVIQDQIVMGTPNSLSNIHIESIEVDTSSNELWIATQWGLNNFSIKNETFSIFQSDNRNPKSISTDFILDVYIDDVKRLWIGTYSGGISHLDYKNNYFHQVDLKYGNGNNYYFQASCFLVDDKTLWIGGMNDGIIEFDSSFNYKNNYYHFSPVSVSLDERGQNSIDCLFKDTFENIWLGYLGWGLALFDKEKRQFERIELPIKKLNRYNALKINSLTQDSFELLWIGTNSGLFYIDLQKPFSKNIKIVDHNKLQIDEVITLFEDRRKRLWISTRNNGTFHLDPKSRKPMRFKHYFNKNEISDEFCVNYINSIFEDLDSTIWLGTDCGLYSYCHTNKIKEEIEFNRAYIGSIIEIFGSKNKNLWMLHETNGLIRYNPYDSSQNIKQFSTSDGLPFDEFNTLSNYQNSFYQSQDGKLFISSPTGSGNGFLWFHPDSVKDNKKIPKLSLTEFKVGNKSFSLDSSITAKKHITLKYNQNFFSFEFAALDFLIPEKNQYAYYLAGLEDDWTYTGNMRLANYTGVPPGEYTFLVKGSNNDGYWNETGISIHISILPPFWRTWWAYLVYILVFIAIVYSIIHYYLRRQKLIHNLEIEHLEAEKLKELDSLKTRFFTNISHEFRTPLTLILGPGKQLISKLPDPTNKHTLSIILKNANRLRVLVNQLLSLSKLDSGKMQLHATETNIIPLVRGYVQSFESLAKQNKIGLIFKAEKDKINVWIDIEKLEQILYNLLSNAFKFTKSGDRIEVIVGTQKYTNESLKDVHVCSISVSDSGSGIPKEKLANIFDRFYQADDSLTRSSEGTGIGLAVVKELVSLHHGEIRVESEPGHGAIFNILFPLDKEHLKPDEIVDEHLIEPFESTTLAFEEVNLTEQPARKDQPINTEIELPLMLIVEDNSDMRDYISSFFNTEYQIIESENGKEGMIKTFEYIPDIIISDIMMPEMDGNEFCNIIKKDERSSHIPIILLTAKASKESRIEGLETGADDFITKPFDGDELKVRVNNLVEQRSKLRKLVEKKLRQRKSAFDIEFDDSNISSMDEKFLQKLVTILGKQYANPELKVEEFTKEVGLSRIQLHRKITALTGTTTSEFIRNFRLNRAAELLKLKSGSISEIAYDVGFNSPSYFTESFRKYFGVPPSDYTD